MDEAVITIATKDVQCPARLVDGQGTTLWRNQPDVLAPPARERDHTIRIPALADDGAAVVLELVDVTAPDPLDLLRMRETEHRSRNLIALALAVARQSLRDHGQDPRINAMFDRLQSLNAVVSSGCEIEGDICPLSQIALSVTARFENPAHPQIARMGPDIAIATRWAHVLTLVLHELAVNAIRHGALSVPEGRVDLRWSIAPIEGEAAIRFAMTWRELDGPFVISGTRRGTGTRILAALVGSNPRCTADLRMPETGIVYTLSLRLAPEEIVCS